MGEERILRGELIYTFNYLGSTPLLGDAFRFSTRALGAAALASPSQGCCSTAGIDLGLGACHCSSERCWCFFSFSFCHNECNARSVSSEFTTSSCVTHPEHKGGQQCGVGRRQLVEGGGGMWGGRQQNSARSQETGRWQQLWHLFYSSQTIRLVLFMHFLAKLAEPCPNALQKQGDAGAVTLLTSVEVLLICSRMKLDCAWGKRRKK